MSVADVVYFDTLAYANKLKNAGVPSEQAEIQAEALLDVFDGRITKKQDLDDLKQSLSSTEKSLSQQLNEHIESIDNDIKSSEQRISQKINDDIKSSEQRLSQKINDDIKSSEQRLSQKINDDIKSSEQRLSQKINDDIKSSEQRLSQKIDAIDSSLRKEFLDFKVEVAAEFAKVRSENAETKVEIIKWMVTISMAQAALIVSLLKFFH